MTSQFVLSSGFCQRSALGTWLFNIYIYNTYNVIKFSNCIPSADDKNRAIKTLHDCSLVEWRLIPYVAGAQQST
jgi:hypothetical protein